MARRQFATAADDTTAPDILAKYTAEDHRKRLQNIATCNREIRQAMRIHLVTDYLFAQATYNLGEYPSLTPWNPDESDERELDRLKAMGIQLIQVFDEWSDALGLFGGDRHAPLNPDGYRRFVDMVHKRGMKILTYCSSGYFDLLDPNFTKDWMRPEDCGHGGWWQMARCAPASPGWRAYLLPRFVRMLDDLGTDGIYNDWGYAPNLAKTGPGKQLAPDEVAAFDETDDFDGAATDFLALMYSEVKRRGGIVKLHADFSNQPMTRGLKVYDYLWVGELVDTTDGLRQNVKNHPPYVVPCIHQSIARVEGKDEPFLHSIPYMQFPLLTAGQPWTGTRGSVPGVSYPEKCGWTDFCHQVEAWHKAHPNGPHVYSGWDACPPLPETQETHARWLKLYKPLTEDGTYAWLEVSDSSLFGRKLPEKVVASVFANRELYLVIANYGTADAEVALSRSHIDTAETSAPASKVWTLRPRSLRILRRVSDGAAK